MKIWLLMMSCTTGILEQKTNVDAVAYKHVEACMKDRAFARKQLEDQCEALIVDCFEKDYVEGSEASLKKIKIGR